MDVLLNWFQSGPVPSNAIEGTYNLGLVALSYFIAVLASYVALDLAGRLRAEKKGKTKFFWWLGGAFAMGAGIWSMHFIGMLAFIMPMPMSYDFFWTGSSMLVAILVSGFALYLIRSEERKFTSVILGGVFLGLGIVTMHYMGMEGMKAHVNIHYLPGLFFLSILIAIVASEAALWLILQSNRGSYRRQLQLKIGSALVMGAAICGMHYTGMVAAVFTPLAQADMHAGLNIDPFLLAFYIAGITGVIITIALIASTYKQLMVSAVQNEKNFLNAMLDNLEDGIIASDASGKITLINRTLQKKLNISENSKLSQDLSEYFILYPINDRRKFTEKNNPLVHALQGKRIQAMELVMKLKDNTTRDVVIEGQPIISTEGKRLGAVVVIHDVTERLRVEKLKNEFVSIVSHELRTPLTSIRGSLSLIVGGAAGELNEKTKGLLDIANNNCERLIRLINDILDIEKIEAGKMEFVLQPILLSELVKDAVAANQAFGDKFGVKIQLEESVPEIRVNVDRDRLTQVLTNLISNAVKFSPQGEAVSVLITKSEGWIKVAITDKGKGIPEEFQQRIFQKFAQADSSSMRQRGGTGLGLSISKTIIEKLGGKLGFTTQENQGTTFYFQLPVWHEATSAVSAKEIPYILVCEDDKDVANLLSVILADNGFRVDVAYSIEQAKKLLEAKKFDAMTLDLVFPDGNGINLVQELRKEMKYKNLPIVVVSGKIAPDHRLFNGDAINILDWLSKPIEPKQLAEVIQHIKNKLNPAKPVILHIEDDLDILKITHDMFETEATFVSATTLHEAKNFLATGKFDLVLLDLMLPDGSGIELLPLLAKSRIPVIVFSAFELPKDYAQYVTAALTKSRTSNSELLAAIKAAIAKIGDNYVNP